jgi:hypothetical protein
MAYEFEDFFIFVAGILCLWVPLDCFGGSFGLRAGDLSVQPALKDPQCRSCNIWEMDGLLVTLAKLSLESFLKVWRVGAEQVSVQHELSFSCGATIIDSNGDKCLIC